MSVYAKVFRVQQALDYLKKDGRNDHFRYTYVSATQAYGAARKAMDEIGLLLECKALRGSIVEGAKAKGMLTEVDYAFRWVCAESGEKSDWLEWYGQGTDSGEKGPGKAATYALKSFLFTYFLVPRDDLDPDTTKNSRDSDSGVSTPREKRASSVDIEALSKYVKADIPKDWRDRAQLIISDGAPADRVGLALQHLRNEFPLVEST